MTTDFKKTLAIFQTEMPIRADMKELDNRMYLNYQKEKIFEKFVLFCKQQKTKFTLHDGPPYANGPIHLGHAYNKIMKDIAIRSHAMMGYDVYTTPGWDCHGLPIEHKVMQQHPHADKVEMKKYCRKYAQEWVEDQKQSFKKLGVMMDFDFPYKTMNYEYQADIMRAFGKMTQNKYIYRSKKTIPWCCKCQTTLATAEIEYQNKKDPSLYVLFKVANTIFYDINELIYLVVWTTTPWTLPLNRGVMLKKNATYLLLLSEGKYLIVGKDSYQDFYAKTNKEYTIIREFSSDLLQKKYAMHPFEKDLQVSIILEDVVELGEGTACVHTAPGCGPIDYEIGIKNHLEIYSPISNDGRYTAECKVTELVNKTIEEALGWVIQGLSTRGILWYKGSINHSYPHCWRSKDPLIFRATPQWFCNLEKNNFKERVNRAINKISFWPAASRAFLESTIANRWEWCISRQRAWGVPIAALLHEDGHYWTSYDFIIFVADNIAVHGVEYWEKLNIADVAHFLPSGSILSQWKKETDILDVWFDSGVSHFAVLQKQNRFPADVYLEGVDQHRGWFQSSLLTSVALYDCAPMRTIVSCGHTVDEKGQKMSKSLGNVISPDDIINAIGLDGLRLWVSSVNLGGDIVVGKKVFDNINEVYRKIRNTCRFAVQNLHDFHVTKDSVMYSDWTVLEKLIIEKMLLYQMKIVIAYQEYNYTEIFHTFIEIFNTILSSFYFDCVKDILYCYPQNSQERRLVQTVLYIILESLTRLMTPIIPYTADDITNYYRSGKRESIQLSLFYDFIQIKDSPLWQSIFINGVLEPAKIKNIISSERYNNAKKFIDHSFDLIVLLREKVFAMTEKLRQKNIIKQSVEAQIDLYISAESAVYNYIKNVLMPQQDDIYFSRLLQVSGIKIILIENDQKYAEYFDHDENIAEQQQKDFQKNLFFVSAKKHLGMRCQRCWKYFMSTNNVELCNLCDSIVSINLN